MKYSNRFPRRLYVLVAGFAGWILFALLASGCSSTEVDKANRTVHTVPATTEKGPQAIADLAVVSTKRTTIVNKDANGKILGTTETIEEELSAKTSKAGKHEEKMAGIHKDEVVGVEEAKSNAGKPSFLEWLFTPAVVPVGYNGYYNGGAYYSAPAGDNYVADSRRPR